MQKMNDPMGAGNCECSQGKCSNCRQFIPHSTLGGRDQFFYTVITIKNYMVSWPSSSGLVEVLLLKILWQTVVKFHRFIREHLYRMWVGWKTTDETGTVKGKLILIFTLFIDISILSFITFW